MIKDPISPGDVIISFIYHNDKSNPRPRPIIVIEERTPGYYTSVYLTKINKSDKIPGLWIEKDSDQGKELKLKYDSFINCKDQIVVSKKQMVFKKSTCSFLEEIKKLL